MEHLLNIKRKGMKYLLINDNSPNNHQKKKISETKNKKTILMLYPNYEETAFSNKQRNMQCKKID